MFTNQDIIKIKKFVEEFFEKMTVPVETEIKLQKEETLSIEIKMEDPKILIGENGQTLIEIQKLFKIILSRKFGKNFYIDLDINNYKKKKIDYLKELARSLADDVALNKKERVLPSMLAYERRIIHLELAERENITTESVGEEPERKVIIKPYP